MKLNDYLSPQELKRLLSALLVVLGFISLAAFFAFLIVPGARYQAHTAAESPVAAVQGETGWLDPTDYPATAKQEIPPIDPKTVMTANPELLARGKKLYGQTCATCHGEKGEGTGPGATGLNPKPRNFTAGDGWKNGHGLDGIYKTLEEGLKGSSMVAYTYLARKDRMALAHYVQSLGSFAHAAGDPKALAALEKGFASAGEVIPNRIPLKTAQARLISEASPSAPAALAPDLASYVWDSMRAAHTLSELARLEDRAFAQALSVGIPGNGFRPEAATLTPAQWKSLKAAVAKP